jgi:hypothetical protein
VLRYVEGVFSQEVTVGKEKSEGLVAAFGASRYVPRGRDLKEKLEKESARWEKKSRHECLRISWTVS